MARDLNEIKLIGRLGQDVDLRYTQAGMAVANISVATNNQYMRGDEMVDEVTWHRVVLWGKVAEVATKYLKKGHRVYISGRMQYRKWVDKDQVERVQAEIVGDDVIFLDRAGDQVVNGAAEKVPF